MSKQSGNFLALQFDFDEDGSLSASIGERGPVDLTSDKYLVLRVTDDDLSDKLTFTCTKGSDFEDVELDISGLTLEEAE